MSQESPRRASQAELDRRQRERRSKTGAAGKGRWKGTTADERRAFMRKVSASRKPTKAVKRLVVSVSMDPADYDKYIRCALKARVPVRTILRNILRLYAPTVT